MKCIFRKVSVLFLFCFFSQLCLAGAPATIDMPVDVSGYGYKVDFRTQSGSTWSFWQHMSGFHATGGHYGANDWFAWDINCRGCAGDSDFDGGKKVYAVEDGEIYIPGGWGTYANGALALQHPGGWTSGYLHLDDSVGGEFYQLLKKCKDAGGARESCLVEKGQVIGRIGASGANNNHLHFAVYDSNFKYGMRSVNVEFSGSVARPGDSGNDGFVSLSDGIDLSKSTVTQGEQLSISFRLEEVNGGSKFFEKAAVAIHGDSCTNHPGNWCYDAKLYDDLEFSAGEDRPYSTSTLIDRNKLVPGDYRVIVKGNVTGREEDWFDFGSVQGTSARNSVPFRVVASTSKPVAPASLSATDGTSSSNVRLTWGAVSGATGYKAFRCETTAESSCTELPFSLTQPSAWDVTGDSGRNYYYRAQACNSAGCSDYSGYDVGYRKPAQPSAPTASDDSYTDKVLVTFTTGNDFRQQVYRCTSTLSSSCGSSIYKGTRSPYEDRGAEAGVKYYYRTKNCGDHHCSEYSWYNPGSRKKQVIKPVAPASLSATDGTSSSNVRLTWGAVSGATGYKAFRCETTAESSCTELPFSLTQPSAWDVTGDSGRNYYYRAQACNSAGCSDYSGYDVGYRKPAQPSAPTASDDSYTDKVLVTFTTGNDFRQQVYRCTSTLSSSCGSSIYKGTRSPYEDRGAEAGVKYYYRTKNCGDHHCSEYSWYNPGSRKKQVIKPVAPASLSATDGTSSSNVRLTWGAVSGATGYKAFRCETTAESSCTELPFSLTQPSAWDVTGDSGRNYYYRAQACNSAGCSDYSGYDVGYRKPAQPSAPTASDDSYTDKVLVTFTTGNDFRQQVYRCTSTLSSSCGSSIYKGTRSPYEDRGAEAGVKYYYRTKNCGDHHCSEYSWYNPGSRKKQVIKPVAPASLSATDGTSSSNVRLTWGAVSGATGYKAFRCETTAESSCTELPFSLTQPSAWDVTGDSGRNYYYRAQACNSAGCSDYSGYDVGWKKPPKASTPNATVGTYADKVRITYGTGAGAADRHRVYRCTSAALSSCGEPIYKGSQSSHDDFGATAGVQYYYRVRDCHDYCGDYSNYNAGLRKVAVPFPVAPVTIAPSSGGFVRAGEPLKLSFALVVNASRYHVKVFDRAGKKISYSNERVMPSVCSGGKCSITVPGLPAQERAVWWVRAVNQAGWGAWSSPVYFDVEQAVSKPATPRQIAPANGSAVLSGDSIQISFAPVANASRYHVKVFDRAGKKISYSNERVMPSVCSGGKCSITVPGLPAQERAVWWVRAVNQAGWGEWSNPVYFDVEQAVSKPATPRQITPANGSAVLSGDSIQISFASVVNASRYHVKVFDRAGKKISYSNERVMPSVCSGGKCSITVPGLPAQERAVWWVRAVNQAGWGEWSNPVYFDVEQAVSKPATPRQITPANGSAVPSGDSIQISFAPVTNASRYHVKVFDRAGKKTSYSNERVMPSTCSGGKCSITVPGLPVQERAVWWVRAVNQAGWGAWSSPFYFDVEQVLSKSQPLMDAGRFSTCVVNSNLVCWGSGVSEPGSPLKNPVALTLGNNHACALDDTGVVCWGNGDNGKLDVPALRNPVAVSADYRSTCALDDTGVVCWGSVADADVPYLSNPREIYSGPSHRCVLDDTGLKCWGNNNWGQLDVPILQNPTSVALGTGHSCALDSLGVTCWGLNNYGQADVPLLSNPRSITAGALHSCALDDNGVTCWGAEDFTSVPQLSGPISISAGKDHTCAFDASGYVCWGANDSGQVEVPYQLGGSG